MAKLIVLLTIIVIAGCSAMQAIKFEAFEKPLKPNSADPKERVCVLGKTRTTQGHDLCDALERIIQRKGEITEKSAELSNHKFDVSQIGWAVLSAGALAADSHVSVLETLGILTATTVGLRSYASVIDRRSAYTLGHTSLTCLEESTKHLLWDDRSYYRLLGFRFGLTKSLSDAAKYASISGVSEDLVKKYNNLTAFAEKSKRLADNAVYSYAGLGVAVDEKRFQIINGMRSVSDKSRGDISTIVTNIVNAQAVKNSANNEVDKTAQDTNKSAGENTPSSPSVNQAQDSLEKETKNEVATLEDNAASPSVKALSTLGNEAIEKTRKIISQLKTNDEKLAASLGTIAKAMQEISTIAPRYVKASNDIKACPIL